MEIKEYYKGCRVNFNGEPESTGEIVELSAVRARVSWDNGNTTWEMISDLEPNLTQAEGGQADCLLEPKGYPRRPCSRPFDGAVCNL